MTQAILRTLVLLITFLTGFTGLVYEVTWHHYLSNLLGSQAQAASLIIAVFLGGLSLGYLIFGALTNDRSPRTLLRWCGWIEISIGGWALLFPQMYGWIWESGIVSIATGFGLVRDLCVAIVLIGLPTTLMGGTLPVLTQGLSINIEDASRFHTRIYAVNTGGAFLGSLIAGFLFIPELGLPITVLSMGVINLLAGVTLVLLSRSLSKDAQQRTERIIDSTLRSSSQRPALVRATSIAFLAGFYSISIQTVIIRLVGLSMGSSEYAFSMVVSAFILMLALGAWRLADDTKHSIPLWINQLLVVTGLVVLYITVPYWPYGAHILRTLLTNEAPTFYLYYTMSFLILALLLLLPVGAMGSTLPLLFRDSRDRFGSLGRNVGIIYGANTFGCVLGALFGGHLLLYVFDLDEIFLLCSLLALAPLTLLVFHVERKRERNVLLILSGVLAISLLTLDKWPREVFAMGTFRLRTPLESTYKGYADFYSEFIPPRTLIAYKDDPNTTVAVIETVSGSRSIYVNGKSDGSTSGGDRITTKLLAHIPALFGPSEPHRAAVIGFGTGITVGSLALHPQVQAIDVLEIAPFVEYFAPLFDAYNHGASNHAKVTWNVTDAYRFLLSTPNVYGLIVSEPSNPWVTGVERLYAKEFYAMVRAKLAPGGVYAQWMHTYSISEGTLGLVFHTFVRSFPHVRVFVRDYDLVLLGSEHDLRGAPLAAAAARLKEPAIEKDLRDIGYQSLEELLAGELWVPFNYFRDAGQHSLDFPQLSHRAGFDFFRDRTVEPEQYMESSSLRPWSRRLWTTSLLYAWMKQRQFTNPVQTIAQSYCREAHPHFVKGWQNTAPRCRAALMALGVRELIPDEAPAPTQQLALLRYFSGIGSDTSFVDIADQSVETIADGIKLYGQYGAPFTTLQPQRLRLFASPCFQVDDIRAVSCRAMIVEALAANGNIAAAREIFDGIAKLPSELLSADTRRRLRTQLEE